MISPASAAALLGAAILCEPAARVPRARLAAVVPAAREATAVRRCPPRVLAAAASGVLVGVVADSVVGWVFGALLAAGIVVLGPRLARLLAARARTAGPAGQLAATWDLLAACLRSGLAVPTAIRAVAEHAPEGVRATLLHTGELLALGADPADAWVPALAHPPTAPLARGAKRTARSGAALAEVARGLAEEVRAGLSDEAEAAAQRAAVLVTLPLGLCFLPAFLCLGVVPVVIGLASALLKTW
jgi:pilus assembly protein TadC